jgi:hypothetical protein
VDQRFEQVDQRFERLEIRMENGFRELRQELNAMHRSMHQFAMAAIVALAGLIATQLGLILTQI